MRFGGGTTGVARRAAALVAVLATVTACSGTEASTSSTSRAAAAPQFYIDSAHGSDDASGTSPAQAWKTFAPLAKHSLVAGATVSLAKGATFEGPLPLKAQGSDRGAVVVQSYGDGAAPLITVPGEPKGTSCVEVSGQNIVIRDLHLRACGWSGVSINGNDVKVTQVESEGSVAGVAVSPGAERAVISFNRLHDNNKMSVLTQSPSNDDSGAFGVILNGHAATVSDNIISGCAAFSYDYGTDGSGIEIFDSSDNVILRNRITECTAGTEMGGTSRNNMFGYNVVVNTSFDGAAGVVIHGPGDSNGPVTGTSVVNNTILVNTPQGQGIDCTGDCRGSVATILNNLVSAHQAMHLAGGGADYCAVYGLVKETDVGDHMITLPAAWTDQAKPPEQAIHAGTATKLTADVFGNNVRERAGDHPTIGAIEP